MEKVSKKEVEKAYELIARYRGQHSTPGKQRAARVNGAFGGRPAKAHKTARKMVIADLDAKAKRQRRAK